MLIAFRACWDGRLRWLRRSARRLSYGSERTLGGCRRTLDTRLARLYNRAELTSTMRNISSCRRGSQRAPSSVTCRCSSKTTTITSSYPAGLKSDPTQRCCPGVIRCSDMTILADPSITRIEHVVDWRGAQAAGVEPRQACHMQRVLRDRAVHGGDAMMAAGFRR